MDEDAVYREKLVEKLKEEQVGAPLRVLADDKRSAFFQAEI